MRKAALLCLLPVLFAQPAHAIIVDAIISGAQYAKDEAYQTFMKLKVIEQIKLMKDNYDASVRYYKEFKQLNAGRGIFQNVVSELKTAAEKMGKETADQARKDYQDFLATSNNHDTDVDKFFKGMQQRVEHSMKYAADEQENVAANRKSGVDIAKSADGLSPKDAANLSAKASGIQVQMLTQIHEDNLRIIQLQSMQLAAESRRGDEERRAIDDMRKSVERRSTSGGRQ
ncbi:MAG: hypothetical protein WCU88_09840 [Elusimicrobiota bacterium]|jgi:conjugal transfer/entry exclusion protein